MLHAPIYLDCNATTPVEEEVIAAMIAALRSEYGNAGSRTHSIGVAAAQAVRRAREKIASVVDVEWDSVIFTSGATESNNLAILGLADTALRAGKKHVVSTQIEHKAVLEPIAVLAERGVEVTLIQPGDNGVVTAQKVIDAIRDDTFLVSVMHVNNETGAIQPIQNIANALGNHPAVLHTDSAQGFGKDLTPLRNPRVDLISISGHKIYGPKGIGALIVRPNARVPRLKPIMFGGGQERGLRPGTVPVPLVVGLGVAAELSLRDQQLRRQRCLDFRSTLLAALSPLNPIIHGDLDMLLPNVVNLRFGEIDSEAIMIALRDSGPFPMVPLARRLITRLVTS